jgi:hypothetical protein
MEKQKKIKLNNKLHAFAEYIKPMHREKEKKDT